MKRRTILVSTVILAVFSVLCAGSAYAQNRPAEVKTVKSELTDIWGSILASGVIEDAGEKQVFSPQNGIIAEIYVTEGSKVVTGQALMKIDAVNGGVASIPDLDSGIIQAAEYFGLDGLDSLSGSFYGSYETTGENFYIAAPCDGTVTALSGKEGSLISAHTSCAAVSAMDELYVRASISESNVSDLMTGMTVELTGDGFSGRTYKGVLYQIMPQAKQSSSLTGSGETIVETLIYIKDPDEFLRPGYTTNVKIITTKTKNTIVVPYEAVFQDENNNQTVLVVQNGYCYPRIVETGLELDDVTQILSGLAQNEEIVFSPDKTLYKGGRVK